VTRNITRFRRLVTLRSKQATLLRRTGFILADVQIDVLWPSRMHVTAFSIDHTIVNHILWYASPCLMRRCFKSLVSPHFPRSCLKANKVNESEETKEVEYMRIISESVLMLFIQNHQNQSVLVETCSLANLDSLFWDTMLKEMWAAWVNTTSDLSASKNIARLVGRLGSGPCLVSRLGLGSRLWVG